MLTARILDYLFFRRSACPISFKVTVDLHKKMSKSLLEQIACLDAKINKSAALNGEDFWFLKVEPKEIKKC